MDREITWVQLSSGRQLDAALLVCPECHILDVHTDVDTSDWPNLRMTHIGARGLHQWTAIATDANTRTN